MSRTTKSNVLWAALAIAAATVLVRVGQAQQVQRPAPDVYGQLHWRFIGPEGNRFDSVAGIPGDPTTYYVGAA